MGYDPRQLLRYKLFYIVPVGVVVLSLGMYYLAAGKVNYMVKQDLGMTKTGSINLSNPALSSAKVEMVGEVKKNSLYLNSGGQKISSVELRMNGVKGFEPNTEVFSNIFVNKVENGKILFSAGILKPSAQLPFGEILLGTIEAISDLQVTAGSVMVGPGANGATKIDISLQNLTRK